MEPLLRKIQCQLNQVIQEVPHPIAAFDADGTLWSCDVGKTFFQYQVQKNLLKIPDPQKQFDHIQQTQGKKRALQWIACIQAGTFLDDMKQWVKDFLKQTPPQPFIFQQHLIRWLQANNVTIFIVSSSLKWILDQVMQIYSIPSDQVIGVETQVESGVITDRLILPTPIQEDKPKSLQSRTKMPAVFAAGNTLSDQQLLESATHVRLVVSSAQKGHRNYISEQKMLQLAQQHDWFHLEPMRASN